MVGDNTSRMVSSFGSSIEDMQQFLAGTIKQHAEEHRQQADRVFAGLKRSIEQALNNTGKFYEALNQEFVKDLQKRDADIDEETLTFTFKSHIAAVGLSSS